MEPVHRPDPDWYAAYKGDVSKSQNSLDKPTEKRAIHLILQEFDLLIADAPLDFLGTGESSRHAAKEEREWHKRMADLRRKIEDMIWP